MPWFGMSTVYSSPNIPLAIPSCWACLNCCHHLNGITEESHCDAHLHPQCRPCCVFLTVQTLLILFQFYFSLTLRNSLLLGVCFTVSKAPPSGQIQHLKRVNGFENCYKWTKVDTCFSFNKTHKTRHFAIFVIVMTQILH